MPIETTLERIAVALEKLAGNAPLPTNATLITPLAGAPADNAAQAQAATPKRGPGAPKAEAKQPDKPTAPVPPAPDAAAAAPKQDAEKAAAAVYENLKQLSNKLATLKDAPFVKAILAEFGVATGKDLKPDQWAPYITRLTAEIKAIENPPPAETEALA